MSRKCTKCGSSGPFYKDKRSKDGNTSRCKRCLDEQKKQYYKDHKKERLEYIKKWQDENPNRVKKYKQKWKDDNPEVRRRHGRDKYWRDPERWREATSKWRKENPEKNRRQNRNREYAARGADGSHAQEEWIRLCDKYGNRCLKCGRDGVKLTVDHVVPISKGGSNDISNIQPLCMSCNASKQAKSTDYRNRGSIVRWIQKKLF